MNNRTDPLSRRLLNPATGDRITILSSPLMGDPGPLVFCTVLPAHAAGSPPHDHGALAETFRVESGVLAFVLDGREMDLRPGDSVHVPAGVSHGFRNAASEPVAFVSEVTPGEGFERFLRGMYGLAASGETNAAGMPKDPRAMALLLAEADLTLTAVPRGVQAVLGAALRTAARWAGIDNRLARLWTATPPAVEAAQ